MPPLLDNNLQEQVRGALAEMKEEVYILFFSSKENHASCDITRQLLDEVAVLSDRLEIGVYDLDDDPTFTAQYHVDKTPYLVIASKDENSITDYGIYFAGTPTGYEFITLIQDILLVSSRDSGLETGTREQMKLVQKPVRLQVFTTPT